ncbi:hypothetical protein CJ739_3877 [Mariniflexile rhizosphaerae]|uniref:WapI family immunity protein n=1 Tax=unclassified Mariniflexile TaxID=2643887 RepID=UPI000E334B86|nr:hypothetical protein [Mariniflexile sp. TRM1-10]AXP82936.1 hypothetical protein CJ739_3877 [Mariniflexile sp. TRM1-10]
MTIQNEIGNRKIELNISDFETVNYPSYRLKINLSTEELNAEFNRPIWISLTDLESFIQKLTELDKTRTGDIKMESMSPDEFYLRFRNIDNLGHLSVELKIQKESPYQKDSDLVKMEFEFDPTNFPKIINELTELKNVC